MQENCVLYDQKETERLIQLIDEKIKCDKRVMIALDGRCAAGKSLLAAHLSEIFKCTIFHMDDFFLRPLQRTEERLKEPGGNVDRERFLSEVLKPLKEGAERIYYCRYDCKSQLIGEPSVIIPERLCIVEGSYSCHPLFFDYYDLHVFMTVDKTEQFERIIKRNGAAAAQTFKERWIPMEEQYFEKLRVKDKCDIVIKT